VRRFPPAALVALVAALALVLAGCGDDSGGGGDASGGGRSVGTKDEPVTEFTIVAENIHWNLDRIVVPAGEELTATIDNRDDGGGGGGGGRSAGTKDEPVTEFTIVAEGLRFDLDRIVVPAGQEVTATVDNRDTGIGHNFSVALDGDEAETEVKSGPIRQTLRFTIDEPGEHDFVCDPHAATMKGVVEAV